MKRIILVLVTFFSFSIFNLSAQGCSDAGFCTIGSSADFSSDFIEDNDGQQKKKHKKHFVKLSSGFHLGEMSTFIFIPTADLSFQAGSSRSRISLRFSSQTTTGNMISSFGFGDIAITHSYNFLKQKKHALIFNYGAILATSGSNLKSSELDLPMVYQSSLGTFDMLMGANYKFNYKIGSVNVASGYQHPFVSINKNSSFVVNDSELDVVYVGESFLRAGDLFFRTDKIFTLNNKKADFAFGLLGIYHVANDQVRFVKDDTKQFSNIEGSKGLTLNITAAINYRINSNFEFGLSAGFPVIVRDARPDGLTRSAVVSPSILYRF